MKYLSYKKADANNGSGLRNVLWLSGCSHGCVGCFQPHSHNPRNGDIVTEDFIDQVIEDLRPSYIKGLTLTGGDPLHKRNYLDVIKLCQRVKYELPDKDIWLWTGYTYTQLRNDLLRCEVLNHIDYLVDGKFVQELSKNPPPWRGSANQVLHTIVDGVSVAQN